MQESWHSEDFSSKQKSTTGPHDGGTLYALCISLRIKVELILKNGKHGELKYCPKFLTILGSKNFKYTCIYSFSM